MDATPLPHGLGGPRQAEKLIVPPKPPDIITAWPRCAQIAGAFLLGALASLFGVHALAYWRGGAEPSAIEAAPISYRVDFNEARRAELLQLPGVGPSMADRILEYRRTSGGFRGIDELRKIQGIGPTTLERLRPFVLVKTEASEDVVAVTLHASAAPKTAVKKVENLKDPIDINKAGLAELQKLPGIGPKLSQRIVDEREKRAFNGVDELRRVPGIGPKTLEKIKPYVTVGVKM